MTDRGEAIRFGGTVRAIERAPELVIAVVGKQSHAHDTDGTIVVDVIARSGEPPQPIRVTVPGDALVHHGKLERAGWGELVEKYRGLPLGLAQAFERGAVEVRTVKVGDAVEIYGEVDRREFADDGGMRDVPSSRVAAARALIVATGDERVLHVDEALEKRYPPAKRPVEPSWAEQHRLSRDDDPRTRDPGSAHYRHDLLSTVSFALLLAIAAGFGLVALGTRSPRSIVGFYGAITFVALYRPRPVLAVFHSLEKRYEPALHLDGWGFGVGMAAAPIFIVMLKEAPGAAVYVISLLLGLALLGGLLGLPTFAHYRALLRAPRWDGSLGTYAAIEGLVKDPTPARLGDRDVAIGRGTGFDESIGSNPDKEVWQRFHGVGTFLVVTKHGTVEVSPRHVVWATSVRGRHDTSHDGADYEAYEVIPTDGKVLAVGWIDRAPDTRLPQLLSRETKPALLVATGPHGDPRQWLGRLLVSRLVSIVLVVGLFLVGIFVVAR